ncbi:MAG TPA: peptidoglycan DD-metalloendopeptidase family protein [Actinomycetota bacterium]|nr:peptidoglycan DD-metalloendopeptidase family protein [Actinomycetota bacterium]
MGARTTARGGTLRAALAAAAALLVLGSVPALADPEGELAAAKDRLAAAQAALDSATAAWQAAEAKLAQTEDQLAATRAAIARTQRRLAAIAARIDRRARAAYMSGVGGTIDLLLSSADFTEFSDRLEFIGAVAENDSDLITLAEVTREELRRKLADLARLREERARDAERLERARSAAAARVDELARVVADLERQLEARQAQLVLGVAPSVAGAIQVCPVQGPNSFVDSFGAPRSGGRSHQGIDLIAPYGTPVVAVHAGNAVRSSNLLGGLAVIVYHTNGDYSYYAHLSSYGAAGAVRAGTVIGYVGSTGNAGSVNHLHFEYHPGGGGAINPYAMLRAVC